MALVDGEAQRACARAHDHAASFEGRDLIEIDQFVVEGDDVDPGREFVERVGVVGRTEDHCVGRGDGRVLGRRREDRQDDAGPVRRLAHHPRQLARSHHPH